MWPAPQIIKIGGTNEIDRDLILTVEAANVIDDTTQVQIDQASLDATFNLINLKTGAETGYNVVLIQSTDKQWYYINLDSNPTFKAAFENKTKYVGSIEKRGSNTMRIIAVEEFAVDDGAIEAILATKAYRFEDLGTATAKMVWYDDQTFTSGQERYYALVYEGGTGTTPASRPERVTHRGPVTPI
jgi:hypothetical protein